MTNIILLGAPGAGKGTLAGKLKTTLNIPHISTGDLLREEVANETEIGLKVKSIMANGELVSDDIITAMLKNRVQKDDAKNGFILDGYPRNLEQAKELDKIITNITDVIEVYTPFDVIIDRMATRRTCPKCSAVYNTVTMPPKTENICDVCGTELTQRKDDTREVVAERLNVYEKTTTPVIDFYKSKDAITYHTVSYKEDLDVVVGKFKDLFQA